MIPTWKTEEKDKNLKKWAKMAQNVSKSAILHQLKSPETPLYEFSRGYGY